MKLVIDQQQKWWKIYAGSEDVPSGGSFSYFVSFDVLKTPFILTAAFINQASKVRSLPIKRYKNKQKGWRHKGPPDLSDNGKKCAKNVRILPQNTTSLACKTYEYKTQSSVVTLLNAP